MGFRSHVAWHCCAPFCIWGSSCYSIRVNVQKGMQGNASGFEVAGDLIWSRAAWASVFWRAFRQCDVTGPAFGSIMGVAGMFLADPSHLQLCAVLKCLSAAEGLKVLVGCRV